MTAPTYLMLAGGMAALAALMLSVTRQANVARKLGLGALWLSLMVVPLAVTLDLTEVASTGAAVDGATVFSQTLEHVKSYGAIALPCAFVASLAMNRAKAVRVRR
jgi:hypothetical protein